MHNLEYTNEQIIFLSLPKKSPNNNTSQKIIELRISGNHLRKQKEAYCSAGQWHKTLVANLSKMDLNDFLRGIANNRSHGPPIKIIRYLIQCKIKKYLLTLLNYCKTQQLYI